MKPPARKTGSSNARDDGKASIKTKKRKRLSYRSPHAVRETKKNVSQH